MIRDRSRKNLVGAKLILLQTRTLHSLYSKSGQSYSGKFAPREKIKTKILVGYKFSLKKRHIPDDLRYNAE